MSGAVEWTAKVEAAIAAFDAASWCDCYPQGGALRDLLAEALAAKLDRLTTPPVRSYADGVKDAARVAEKAGWQIAANAIRLLSQGGKA